MAAEPSRPPAEGGEPAVLGRLVAVNVGLPRDVSWRGRTVHTGIWKQPVDGPRMVRTLNIDGDGQGDLGGHGGPHRAVMVYQLDSYEYWRGQLDRADLTDSGMFGENFTVDGLPDSQVCVGDRYEIGGALFEVSQPRVTCYRVGLRLDEPRLPALLVAHRRPGFYLRVLREGLVRAGDEIVRVASGPERMTVAEVDGLLYLPGHDREAIGRALRITALSPGWQASFHSLLATDPNIAGNPGLVDIAAVNPVAWPGFRRLRVIDTVRESDTVLSLRLASADGGSLPAALPGQFVALRLTVGAGQAPTTRSYSLSGPVGGPDYRVSVKREPGGVVSAVITDTIRPGSVVEVAAPRGGFVLQPGDGPVLLVSAGIGATPVLAMLHSLADTGSRRTVSLLHRARNSAEDPFSAEVRSLLGQLPNGRSEICYSEPLSTDVMGRHFTHLGHLDPDFLHTLPIPQGAHAYICGPEPFMDSTASALAGMGLSPENIATEIFGARTAITPGIAAGPATPPHQPAGVPGAGPDVTFARSGLTVSWRQNLGSLLELAEACDVPARWSCRTGICHTCETGLLAGPVRYDPAPIDLPANGNVLLCCASPDAEVVIDL